MRLRVLAPWVLGAAMAAAAGRQAHPTGHATADVLWCALFGLIVGGAAAAVPPWVWFAAIATLAPCAWGDASAVAALAGIVVLAYTAVLGRLYADAAGVLIGGLLPVVLLRLGWPTSWGATAVVSGGVALVVVVVALVRASRSARRRGLAVAGVVTAGVVVAVGATVATAVVERRRIDRAVDAIDAGLDAARAGDAPGAVARFDTGQRELTHARRRLNGGWTSGGRVVPLVAQQLEVTDRLIGAAQDVAEVGGDLATAAEDDALRPMAGRVDLDAVDALGRPLREVIDTVARTRQQVRAVDTRWIAGPLRSAIREFLTRADEADAEAGDALRAVATIPGLLGADGPRLWFVAIVTPAELRGAGGYPGSFAVIRTDHGRIDLEHVGRAGEISEPGFARGIRAEGPAEYLARYQAVFGLDRYPQNATASPHFPSDAESMAARYAAVQQVPIDGVISVDPDAFAAMLGLIGPVTVPGWPEPISASNARQVLLHDEYVALNDVPEQRIDFLAEVARRVFDGMVGGGLPEPSRVGAALGPLATQRHIQLWSRRPAEQSWFAAIGASGGLAPLQGDALAMVVNDATNAKIDWYLHRTLDYAVVRHDDAVTATVTATLRNDAPVTGDPPYVIGPTLVSSVPGMNRMLVSFFTPFDVGSVTLDGQPADLLPITTEQGRNVVELFVNVPAGATRKVRIELTGTMGGAGPYRLDLHHQPVVNPDAVRVTVDGDVLFDGPQDRDLVLSRA
jgi:hypothetical protein